MSRDPLWMEGNDLDDDFDDLNEMEDDEDDDGIDPDSQHDSWFED